MARDRLLSNAPIDKVFWVCDGRILKNMQELLNALNTMDDETFAYHVSKERNDFANWLKDVFGARKLAAKMRKTKKREKAAVLIKTVLDEKKKKLKARKLRSAGIKVHRLKKRRKQKKNRKNAKKKMLKKKAKKKKQRMKATQKKYSKKRINKKKKGKNAKRR